MTQNKADYLATWLREEAERSVNMNTHLRSGRVWGFIAENLPEAEEAFNSVMEDRRND